MLTALCIEKSTIDDINKDAITDKEAAMAKRSGIGKDGIFESYRRRQYASDLLADLAEDSDQVAPAEAMSQEDSVKTKRTHCSRQGSSGEAAKVAQV